MLRKHIPYIKSIWDGFSMFFPYKKSLICGNTHGIPIQRMSLGMSRHIPGASVESVEAGGLSGAKFSPWDFHGGTW